MVRAPKINLRGHRIIGGDDKNFLSLYFSASENPPYYTDWKRKEISFVGLLKMHLLFVLMWVWLLVKHIV